MLEVLNNSHFAYLCTTNQDNQPHITPIFFVFDERNNGFYVVTSSESKKMKNIRANPKVSLTMDIRDPHNPFNNRGVMIQGKATVEKTVDSLTIVKDKRLVKAYEAFRKKYPILQEARTPFAAEYKSFSETLMKITPSKMVYWRGPNFITVNFNEHTKDG